MVEKSRADQVRTEFREWPKDRLEKEISRANNLYRAGKPTGLPDALFEELCARLRELEPASPALALPSPKKGAETVIHNNPMLSLRKVTDPAGVSDWIGSVESQIISVTPKVDGVACTLVYGENGRLKYAATRGDGRTGEVITKAVLATEAVPDRISCGPCEIRGELFLSKNAFKRMKGVSCARNVVAGYVKRNRPDPDFPLQFHPYDATPASNEEMKFRLFTEIGFDDPIAWQHPRGAAIGPTICSATDDRPSWPFDADGLVFRVGSQDEFEALGTTSAHPRGAVALKFADDIAETTVQGFTWDVSRTGAITPVANFAPVNLAGAAITCATLHHVGRYRSLGIRKGSRISVARRGGVIPHVHAVLSKYTKKSGQAEPPDTCPSCGGEVSEVEGASTDAAFLMCLDPELCPKAVQQGVIHYATTVGIKGLGPSLAESLFDRELLLEPADLYRLNADLDDPSTTEQNLIDQIEAHRSIKASTFLTAMGIGSLGRATAALIARNFDIEGLLVFAKPYDLEKLPGIGPLTAHTVISDITRKMDSIKEILGQVTIQDENSARAASRKGGKYPSTPLVGARVLFTGSLQIPRSEAEALAVQAGAMLSKGVNKDLDLLVTSDLESTSAKMRKARDLIACGADLHILSEAQFHEMLP